MKIDIHGFIEINRSIEDVFSFISNLENDSKWRKEINKTIMNSSPKIGAEALEYSNLSPKMPNNLLKLICTKYSTNESVEYETASDSKFDLKSKRFVSATANSSTLFSYKIAFDKSIVDTAIGFKLPTFIIKLVARRDMKKYLRKLKSILENN